MRGVLGLIVLTPNGANLGVVATNGLYVGYENYGGYPQRDTVTPHRLGPNAYGWLAKLSYQHSGYEYTWVRVYSVIGHSVTLLTTVTSYFSSGEASGCGAEEGQERCSAFSVKYAFENALIRKLILSHHIAGFRHQERAPFSRRLPLGLR